MRRHRKFALWMGVIMAVSAVTSEVPDDICEVVKAAENTVSMTDFASSGEAAGDRKSTRLNSSHTAESRMPSSA